MKLAITNMRPFSCVQSKKNIAVVILGFKQFWINGFYVFSESSSA